MEELINDLASAVVALDFQRVLSSQVSIKNTIPEKLLEEYRVELELTPKIGTSDNGRLVFAIELNANCSDLELAIDARAIYAHEPGVRLTSQIQWEYFAHVALPVLTASFTRIRDAVVPLMFAQLDFLAPFDDLKRNLLERANAAGADGK